MSDTRKDVVIIGSGPAGLSAAVYAKRALLDVAVIEKEKMCIRDRDCNRTESRS